ncbi:MAG TPA: hypothetical protein VHV47_11600 [Opitutaceae bacterium]|jgi:hypothetical protein|nr:hypothetical protein [Opitutaceae bacterium]
MRARLLLLVLLVSAAPRLTQADAPDPPVVPLAIPGYALRVLDVQKKVILQAAGHDIEASVPIFIYYPAANRTEAVRLVRQARDGLSRLQAKREWSATELKAVVAQLESGLGELEKEERP